MRVFEGLIARLDAATGPDRELDGEIWREVSGWSEDDGSRLDGVWFRRDPEDSVAFEQPPAYTGSLDAAVTLVRADGYWRVHSECWPTPAIAICIAALRATEAA